MSKIKYIILFAVALLLHSCCSSKQFSENPSLENTEWVLTDFKYLTMSPINTKTLGIYRPDVITKSRTTLNFINGHIDGESNDNDYSGNYSLSGQNISFANISSEQHKTKNKNSFKQNYFNTLKNIIRYQIKNDTLILYSSDTWIQNNDTIYIKFTPLYK